MENEMIFAFLSPVTIEETFKDGRTVVSGTLIVEGRSRNKNYYSLSELEGIAKSAEGVPIRYGTEARVDPNTGMIDPNMHAAGEHTVVGKIVKTVLDKAKKCIKFWAEIVNTVIYPKIAETVKEGWGVSIGGKAKGGRWILDQLGRLTLKVFGVKLDHVQLLKPDTRRGQDEAKVEKVEIQESALTFASLPPIELELSGTLKDISQIESIEFEF